MTEGRILTGVEAAAYYSELIAAKRACESQRRGDPGAPDHDVLTCRWCNR